MSDIDCGDNSCYFAKEKRGMRTNGGCRCLTNAGFSRSIAASAIQMLPELLQLREENARLKEELSKHHDVPLLQVYADKLEKAQVVIEAARKITHRSSELFEAMKAYDEAKL